jgi:riboflavin synthase
MYSGIVQGVARVNKIILERDFGSLIIERSLDCLKNIESGGSISIDGICLTVASYTNNEVSFDLSFETIRTTNIKMLRLGSLVNVETPLNFGEPNGGHNISGHIDGVAEVSAINASEHNFQIIFEIDPKLGRFIFEKGFISLNGCSLTLNGVNKKGKQQKTEFSVWLIPETLKRTNIKALKIGDLVNIEVERQTQVIVTTITDLLSDPNFLKSVYQPNLSE